VSIEQVLQDAVDAGAVPNVAAIAATRDGVCFEGAAGPRAVGRPEPVGVDSHFQIMSMTKIVATAAALQLVEQGRLDLAAPVAEYCPEFADKKVLEGFDGDTPVLRRPAGQATVQQLMTHTTGLSYWFWNADILRWQNVTGTPPTAAGKKICLTAPMVADPGTKFEYGINTDWLGQVVEAAGGKALDVAIKEGVTGPLGMTQTTYQPSPEQLANAAALHRKGEDGTWVASEPGTDVPPEYFSGGHGLYSTPRDYVKFLQALLGNGARNGVRILQESTVDNAFRNQIGELDFPASIPTAEPPTTFGFDVGPGFKFGHGLLLNSQDVPGRRRAWSGAWAGLYNTHFWVDRTAGVAAAIYSQFLPFVTPESMTLYADFEAAVYASL
jgi:methyl acetate hydrolase